MLYFFCPYTENYLYENYKAKRKFRLYSELVSGLFRGKKNMIVTSEDCVSF